MKYKEQVSKRKHTALIAKTGERQANDVWAQYSARILCGDSSRRRLQTRSAIHGKHIGYDPLYSDGARVPIALLLRAAGYAENRMQDSSPNQIKHHSFGPRTCTPAVQKLGSGSSKARPRARSASHMRPNPSHYVTPCASSTSWKQRKRGIPPSYETLTLRNKLTYRHGLAE